MKKELFGTLPDGKAVEIFTLANRDAVLRVMTHGAAIVDFCPFATHIVGGFDTLEDYLADTSHQGALIGRVANRIAQARFEMDGQTYFLPANDGENCLHAGNGFDRKVFTLADAGDDFLTMTYESADGEEGFPGALLVRVTYRLQGTALLIDYTAQPKNKKTPIALTNHSYFNLDGFGGTVLAHRAVIDAERYTEVDEHLIPTARHPQVRGTVFDFLTPHQIGERIGADFIGYDHNYVLTPRTDKEWFGYLLPHAATVENGALQLDVYTDQPGIQFYIANFLEGKPDFSGHIPRIRHGAFCLETQTEPNCIRHGIGFYAPGEIYRHTTVYAISKFKNPAV